MMRQVFLSFILLSFFISCSGIKFLSETSMSDLYTDKFLEQIKEIKKMYKNGDGKFALNRLKKMKTNELLPCEKGLRRNLIGVILFSKGQYEQAIYNFDLAISTSRLDKSLSAQIYLNMASSYFKLGLMEKAYNVLDKINHERLSKFEIPKFYLLKYNLAKEMGKSRDELISLMSYLSFKKSINELKNDSHFQYLISGFFKLSRTEKIRFLEEFEDKDSLCTAYLGYLEVEKLYYNGNKNAAKDLLQWVHVKSKPHQEMIELVDNFFFRIANYSKINTSSIGIVLPLSGRKKKYGNRALLGLDNALISINKNLNNKKFKLYIKDSKGSGAVGAFSVKRLIDDHKVSAIIGGLFSTEATKEYLEAKKHGVFFISLSQIYLPKDQKDHLLLEIPGSVESQVDKLFSESVLESFGKRTAIIYPKSDRGQAYVNEFWRKAKIHSVDVTGVLSYEKNITDFRDPVKNLLGLKFIRERQEELDIYKEIHSLEKHTSTRRIQTLKPQLEFDWVFIPAFPKEALQIIPSFSYYDAFKLNFIGDPSWRSSTLARESSKLGKLYFIGDDLETQDESFAHNFMKIYKRKPKLIEMRSFDAFRLINSLIGDEDFASRDELDIFIKKQTSLSGITGTWFLNDDVWIKNLTALMLKRGRIQKLIPPSKSEENENDSNKENLNEKEKG